MLTRALSSRDYNDPYVTNEETGTEKVSDLPRSPSSRRAEPGYSSLAPEPRQGQLLCPVPAGAGEVRKGPFGKALHLAATGPACPPDLAQADKSQGHSETPNPVTSVQGGHRSWDGPGKLPGIWEQD